MKEICIPFIPLADDKQAEIEVRVPGTGEVWRYRIESISFHSSGISTPKDKQDIYKLQQYIGSYNHDWELIQIIGMNEITGRIHMMYREKQILTQQ